MPKMRCGTVALVGRPNVGKSTLINALLETKVAIVSPKPQTTRNAVRCIYNGNGVQIVFTDTPGIHIPKDKLGQALVDAATDSMTYADVICYLVESTDRILTNEDHEIIEFLKKTDTPIFLIVNKSDKTADNELLANTALMYEKEINPLKTIFVSAKKSNNLVELIGKLTEQMPISEPYYDPDVLIDSTERFLAQELIREQVLRNLRDEVPHCVAVEIDDYKSPEEYPEQKKLYINARLIVETDGQKGIVIGGNGSMLRRIGATARVEIEKSTGYPVYLELRVQTRPGWRGSENFLKRFGYA